MTPDERASHGGRIDAMRNAAFVALPLGALGSVAAVIYGGRRNPSRLLIVLFVLWVLAPFAALAIAAARSTTWSATTRRTVYLVSIIVAIASLASYGQSVLGPAKPQGAFLFVIVPPISCLVAAAAIAAAAAISRP
jgi:hypothetical protein